MSPVPEYNPLQKQYVTIVAKKSEYRPGIDNLIRRYKLKTNSPGVQGNIRNLENMLGTNQNVVYQVRHFTQFPAKRGLIAGQCEQFWKFYEYGDCASWRERANGDHFIQRARG